jgi:GAF domain-containing protein
MKPPRRGGRAGVEPILKAIVRTAARLCDANHAHLLLADGTRLRMAAKHGTLRGSPSIGESLPLTRGSISGRAVVERRTVHVRDLKVVAKSQYKDAAAFQRAVGLRTMLATPLLQDGQAVGALVVLRRTVRPFTSHQIALLKTFADQAAIALENARLSGELEARNRALTDSLTQQTATAEILQVISSSPTDIQPVLDAVVQNAARLCDASDAVIYRRDGDRLRLLAYHGSLHVHGEIGESFPLVRGVVVSRTVLEARSLNFADLQSATDEFPEGAEAARRTGMRAILAVPLMREGMPFGALSVRRAAAQLFTEQQVALLQTFADQAVIAIENVRLFTELEARNSELTESLEQQTATGEILRVISSSPTDIQPVLDAVVENAARFCGAYDASIFSLEGDNLRVAAHHGPIPAPVVLIPVVRGSVGGRCALERRPVHVVDLQAESEEYPEGSAFARETGHRATLSVPLLREGEVTGVIQLRRLEADPFTDRQIALLRTFSDQAVIAIENVRLFRELGARNHDLTEALEQQTATSEILQVISSSPTDLQPVFDIIAESAVKLCGAEVGLVTRLEGEWVDVKAVYGTSERGLDAIRRVYPMRPSGAATSARAIRDCAIAHIPDVLAEEGYGVQEAALASGFRAALGVPMVREGRAIGSIAIGRAAVGEFSERQIKLLSTFADQAVIAIENVRLFSELEARNRDLSESLEQQTATSEILRVISSSPTDLQPVFDIIAESAAKLCGAAVSVVTRFDGEWVELKAVYGSSSAGTDALRQAYPMRPTGALAAVRAIRDCSIAHIPDVLVDEAHGIPEIAIAAGFRAALAVPMLREGRALGSIGIGRSAAGAFSERQIKLLRTFADQAVIAIENVRLFTELEARNHDLTESLEQQTATAEILRVISRSPTDVQPVFDTIAKNARRLCKGDSASVLRLDGPMIHLETVDNASEEGAEALRAAYPSPVNQRSAGGRAILTGRAIHIPDVLQDPDYEFAGLQGAGLRSMLSVPMLRDGTAIGAIVVHTWGTPRPFSSKQMELLQTFADQAVIAIENARLFKELQARTNELTRSVDQLTALGEISQAVSSTLDVETVLQTIVSRASQLAGADGCAIYEYDDATEAFHIRATHNMDPVLVGTLRAAPLRKGEGTMGRAAETREPTQVADIAAPGAYQSHIRDTLLRAGYRALLSVPLLREGEIIGSLSLNRHAPGEFPPEAVEVLKTFATQSALAIQNARLFREIADKSRQLEAASRHKSEFLANMSHELRTPLNAIIGFSEVLNERMFGELNDKQAEYLKDIHASGTHLLSLINDILDLSKVEAGRMELELSDFNLPSAIDSALTLVRERATRRGITLRAAIHDGIGEMSGDERKIRQVLLNLLSNAIKFTPEGGRIEVKAVPENGSVDLSVSDTGVGIAPEDHEAVFEEFRQVGASAAKQEGTGLGLALCRKFVELHGGKIWVTSALGLGATFTFRLPVRQ